MSNTTSEPEVRLTIAERDTRLSARVIGRRLLHYAVGPDPAEDRPAHVRAASSVVWFCGQLAVIQDDANFIALVDEATCDVRFLTLPRGHEGLRLFDDHRGNKRYKLDLEACVSAMVPGSDDQLLLAFGSGSTPAREKVVLVRTTQASVTSEPRVIELPGLYSALRTHRAFSGSELNIEGAVLLPGNILRLFQRGNGAVIDGIEPCNATCDLDWSALWQYLEIAPDAPLPAALAPEIPMPGTPAPASYAPTPREIVRYDLGELDGVRLTFTDATRAPGDRVIYLASAEDSPDAVQDGMVTGTAVGIIDPYGQTRWTRLVGEHGEILRDKAEGMVLDPVDPRRAFVVVDPDDPHTPGELLDVELHGPWW